MKRHKWKLAFVALAIDLVYLFLTISFKNNLESQRTCLIFFGEYLPFFLHFPFSWLFWGMNYKWVPILFSFQTFIIFLVLGVGIEKDKKRLSLIIVSLFYLALLGSAFKGTWDDRIRETVEVVLPKGFRGAISISVGLPNGEEVPLTNGEYVVEIPLNGQRFLKNDLSGLRKYVFNYKGGIAIPYNLDNPKDAELAVFNLNERNNERKFFIGTKKEYESASKN